MCKSFSLIILICTVIFSCASFPKDELKYNIDKTKKFDEKLQISYEYDGPFAYRKSIERIFAQSNLFDETNIINKFPYEIPNDISLNSLLNRSSLKKPEKLYTQSQKHNFNIYFQSELRPNFCIMIPNVILTSATLFLFPGYEKRTVYLVIDYLKNGIFVKRYEYKREVTTWFELFLIFISNQKEVHDKIIDDMLYNFINDFETDKLYQ